MLRHGSGNAPPKIASRTSSIDKVPQLVGQLNADGIASLEADPAYAKPSRSNPPRSLKTALDAATDSRRNSSGDTTSETSEEDYDNLKHDPAAVVGGGKGGGYEEEVVRTQSTPELDGNGNGHKSYEALKVPHTRPGAPRLKSIPVTLNKLKEKGRYILTADDEALRDILKSGIERQEKDPAGAKKRRSKFSDLVFTRQFTAFDRQNADSADSAFHGFFTLFWLGTALFTIKLGAENWRQYGNILGSNEIMGLMFRRDVMVLGLSDGVLCGATGFGLILQWMIFKGWISWNREGWIIQSVWEALYLVAVLGWTLFREWPWTHTVFFVLHGIVMLMKQHSYAFYNGHLSEAYKMRATLLRKLKQLEAISPVKTPSDTTPRASSLVTSYLDQRPTATDLNQRRKSISGDDGASNILQIAAAIESGEPLDIDQIQTFERIINWEIDALSEDLKGKSTKGGKIYPQNLTVSNHYEFIVLPTLVYELEYPRSDSINWYYVAEKGIAVIGVLGVMNMVSQAFIYPVVIDTMEMKDAGLSLPDRLAHFPWILSDLIFPFMMEYMMTWYVIWECILNLLAELTYFADRGFYADWWNSVSWDQFARDWNRPVHNFLLRHVYHSSISSMKVNKYTATLITFFLSACVHELVMWCLFKKLRGYLLFLQMMQIPLVQLSRTRWLKGRATLGNLIFWIGIFTGPSLLCSLYLII
ncbi:MBOAT-domain-containing protein [Mollisia scopiformis]|uniref:MBOAT-domain-containing protein n=1 Tax=Mollisia scopiformis TaxID=149040 RepID=A0A194X6D8_MOLSC|nr:MBOAT-domain-containing protein [Mollisia scopiformis]KUJ15743.1 MBOAT-domain-containing protein [Mollisia scopiformis]